jgi:hypothetical protein
VVLPDASRFTQSDKHLEGRLRRVPDENDVIGGLPQGFGVIA